jgi:hypothetical protein
MSNLYFFVRVVAFVMEQVIQVRMPLMEKKTLGGSHLQFLMEWSIIMSILPLILDR